MLKRIFTLVACCLLVRAGAQEADTLSRWSVGVNAFRVTRMYFDTRIIPELLPGIIIKHHLNKLYMLRFAADYERQDLTTPDKQCCDQIDKIGKSNIISGRVGLERTLFRAHAFRTYAAADLQLAYIHSKYTQSGVGYYTAIRQVTDVFLLGINPTIGIGYRLTPRIYINAETRALVSYDRANYKTSGSSFAVLNDQGYKSEFGFTYRDFLSALTLNVRL